MKSNERIIVDYLLATRRVERLDQGMGLIACWRLERAERPLMIDALKQHPEVVKDLFERVNAETLRKLGIDDAQDKEL